MFNLLPKSRILPFALALTVAVAACSGDDDPTGPGDPDPSGPASVNVTPDQAEVHSLGETVTFEATVLDDNGNELSGVAVEWTSSDEDVLEPAGDDGSFTAVANGSAEVTATADAEEGAKVSATATVQVEQVAASVTLTPAGLTLFAVNQASGFEAEVVDAGGTPLENAGEMELTWSVEGEDDVLTVFEDGTVTALGDGEAEVVATVDGVSGEADVQVEATFAFEACLEVEGEEDGCDAVSITAHAAEE